LVGIALIGLPLTRGLLLLAGLLLTAALLAWLLAGILVLLARILILIAHSDSPFAFRSGNQPIGAELVAGEQRFRAKVTWR
jgi:ABC-type amino acid transport substrate-binding protein